MMSPSRPTLISPTSATRSIGPMTEISTWMPGSSSLRSGSNRGSRNAALMALCETATYSGATGSIEPIQPRSSSFSVRVTNAPARRRRSSSNASPVSSARLPAKTEAIDSRARVRSSLRCGTFSMAMDQHQVSGVDDQSGRLSENDHRVTPKNAVDRHQDSAGEGEPPEADRDVRHLAALRRDPLDDEASREDRLRDEAERGEEVPVPRAGVDVVQRDEHERK